MGVKRLGVWLEDKLIANLEAKKPWDLRCRYERDVVSALGANRPLLSCSLPTTLASAVATPWVRGLLPEGNHLLALATRAKVPTNYYAELLARYGRDIAGAFTISAQPPEPRRWDIEPYDDYQLVEELRGVSEAPGFAVRDDSELSIAGLQNKLLVTALPGGRWGRPRNGQPSTHIMKVADGRHQGLLAAEHACMQLAGAVGLSTVHTDLVSFDEVEVLVVERYDRRVNTATGAIRRIHQEDACQALAKNIDANQGRGKYEQFGGPSFANIAKLIDLYGTPVGTPVGTGGPHLRFASSPTGEFISDRQAGSGTPASDLNRLLQIAVFTFLIGNADAHGKNLSFLLDTNTGAMQLAPLYDTVPTALWPNLRARLAMSINGKFMNPTYDDFLKEGHHWGLGEAAAGAAIDRVLINIDRALSACQHDALGTIVSERLKTLEPQRGSTR
jgi:serine/threonine-protein kinase HipA